jgi:hypothetical protein
MALDFEKCLDCYLDTLGEDVAITGHSLIAISGQGLLDGGTMQDVVWIRGRRSGSALGRSLHRQMQGFDSFKTFSTTRTGLWIRLAHAAKNGW